MVAIPILILLGSSVVIWLSSKRHIRIHWFIGLIGVGLAWISSYFLVNKIPAILKFSIWEPKNLFPTQLILNLDEISWPLSMSVAATLLAIILTRPAREGAFDYREFIALLMYTCVALIAVMSENILSIVTAWMLMEGLIFAFYLRARTIRGSDSRIIGWFTKNLASIFLLILASVVNISLGGEDPFVGQVLSNSVTILILTSSFMRMSFLSISREADQIGWLDLGSATLLELFPAITGFAVLGHLFQVGIPPDTVWVIRTIGGIFLVMSVFHFISNINIEYSSLHLLGGMIGVGLILESYPVNQPGLGIVAAGVISSFLISATKIIRVHERWIIVVPIAISAMLIGMPGSPGGAWANSLVNLFLSGGALGIGVLLSIALAILAVGFLRFSLVQREAWVSSDNLTRMSYFSGIFLFSISGFLIGLRMQKEFAMNATLYFLIMGVVIAVLYLTLERIGFKFPVILPTGVLPPISEKIGFLGRIGGILIDVLKGAGRVFESETGMLWTFVVLQLLVLALVNLG